MPSDELLACIDLLIPANPMQPGGRIVFERRRRVHEIEVELVELLEWIDGVLPTLSNVPDTPAGLMKALKISSISNTKRFIAVFAEIYFADEEVFEVLYGVRDPLSQQHIELAELDLDPLIAPVLGRKKSG